jgi:Asp-tRNA(Asn)/Glu-tRNA(Gln) amidotransferase A subunit family amidase
MRDDGLVPSALGPAPDRSMTGDAALNGPSTGLGLPSVSIPTSLAAEGLPLGTQFIGGPFEEARLLMAARCVETALGFTAAPAIKSRASSRPSGEAGL